MLTGCYAQKKRFSHLAEYPCGEVVGNLANAVPVMLVLVLGAPHTELREVWVRKQHRS